MLTLTFGCATHPAYKARRDSMCDDCHEMYLIRQQVASLPPLKDTVTIVESPERQKKVSARDYYNTAGVIVKSRLLRYIE